MIHNHIRILSIVVHDSNVELRQHGERVTGHNHTDGARSHHLRRRQDVADWRHDDLERSSLSAWRCERFNTVTVAKGLDVPCCSQCRPQSTALVTRRM